MQKITKKAIEAALKSNWEEAVELNKQILESEPKNLDAKNRLGRAYMHVNQADKARESFEEVLKIDPINQVAKKNLRIINNKSNSDKNTTIEAVSLVKEPGTTIELSLRIIGSGITADDLIPGEKLSYIKSRKCIDLYRIESKSKLTSIESDNICNKINHVLKEKEDLTIRFVKGNNKEITVIIKSSLPVFKSQKQDIRPYVKKGVLEEPEIELVEVDLNDSN